MASRHQRYMASRRTAACAADPNESMKHIAALRKFINVMTEYLDDAESALRKNDTSGAKTQIADFIDDSKSLGSNAKQLLHLLKGA